MKKILYYSLLVMISAGLFLTNHFVVAEAVAADNGIIIEEQDTNNSAFFGRVEKTEPVEAVDSRLQNSQYVAKARNHLADGLEVHNFATLMLNNLATVEGYNNVIANHEYSVAMVAANESCNVNLLAPYYQDPSNVWSKISTWAYNTTKAGTANIDALSQEVANAANTVGDAFMQNNDTMSKNMVVARNTWDIGNKVLVDMFANQSKWGTKKAPFPLWGDQKYLYDAQWNQKYGAIKQALVNEFSVETRLGTDAEYSCSLPAWVSAVPNQGPTVPDVYKYDHEDYDPALGTQAILKAHNEYLKLIKERPQGVNLSVMAAPPKQMPPVKEAIHVILWNASNSVESHFTAYPGLPNTWRDFIVSNYAFFNLGREDHVYTPIKNDSGRCPYYVGITTKGAKTYPAEMATYINYYVQSLTTTDRDGNTTYDPFVSAKSRINFRGFKDDSESLMNNRVQTYLDNRLYEEMMRPLAEESKVDKVEFIEYVKNKFAEYGIVLKENFDITNINDYNDAINALKVKRDEYILLAREEFDKLTPTEAHLIPNDMEAYMLLAQAFNAVALDKETVAVIDFNEIDRVPELILEANAERVALWETIEILRQPPNYPPVGCPIY